MISADAPRIDWDAVKHKLQTVQHSLEQASNVSPERLETVRRQRARQLAEDVVHIHAAKTLPVFLFRIDDETYGIELRHVARVYSSPRLTFVPGAPAYLAGIANLQGEVRSVLDLRRLLTLPDGASETTRNVLLLRQADRRVGLLVEQIDDVRHLTPQEIQTAESDTDERFTRYVQGITRDRHILLDVDALLQINFVPPVDSRS